MRAYHNLSLTLLGLAALAAASAQGVDPAPLKNWAAPLSWQPTTQQEKAVAQERAAKQNGMNPQIQPASGTTELGMLVAITPCRLVDTRYDMPTPYGSGASSPLVWTAGSTHSIPAAGLSSGSYSGVANPCVGLPVAEAYSANITVWPQPVGTVLSWLSVCPTGTATATCSATAALTGYEGGTTGTAGISSNGAVIPANASGSFDVYVTNATYVIIDINGYYSPINEGTGNIFVGSGAPASNTGSYNTATGDAALTGNSGGGENTANGFAALSANTSGSNNTAIGYEALLNNTAENNTAVGSIALQLDTTGQGNTAAGFEAAQYNTTGSWNAALGMDALLNNTTGTDNTALGAGALPYNQTGSSNIAIGYNASTYTGSNSNNIEIGNPGASTDSGIIRIGGNATYPATSMQTQFFAAGIYGVNAGGNAVYVTSSGQLSSASSSRRFKRDIEDMGDTTGVVMALRPVRFHYKTPGADAGEEFGLVAEEVDEVAPELVGHGLDGQVDSVHYDKVNAMLLNQVQMQQRQIEEQKREFTARQQAQDDLIQKLESRLTELEERDKPSQ